MTRANNCQIGIKMKTFRYSNSSLDISFYIYLFLIVSPFWIFEFPAIVDAPQHAAQLKMFLGILEGNQFYTKNFKINWFTPYLSSNLILVAVSYLTSPLTAIKVALTFYLITFSIISRLLIIHFKKPKELQLLPLCFLYIQPINMGFIPYIVSISFGAIWFYLYISRDWKPLSAPNLLFSFFLMSTHAIGWAVFNFNISLLHLYKNKFSLKSALSLLPQSIPLFLVLLWLLFSIESEKSIFELPTITYQDFYEKISLLFFTIFSFNFKPLSIISLFLIFIVFNRYIHWDKHFNLFYALLIANLLLYFLTPTNLYSTAYFSDRLFVVTPLIISLLILSIDDKKMYNLLVSVAIVISVVSRLFFQLPLQFELHDFFSVSNKIREQSNIFYLSDYRDLGGSHFSIPPIPIYLHFPHWLSNSKEINVDYNFSYVHNVLVRNRNATPWTGLTSYQYESFNWVKIRDFNYEYILIRDCHEYRSKLREIESKSGFTINKSSGCWHLLQK
jgi:hypothetical protein